MEEKAQGRCDSVKDETQSVQILWSPMKRSRCNDYRDLSSELRFRDARLRVGITKRVVHIFQHFQKHKPYGKN